MKKVGLRLLWKRPNVFLCCQKAWLWFCYLLRIATSQEDEWLAEAYPDLRLLNDRMLAKMHDKVSNLMAQIEANVDRLKSDVLDKLENLSRGSTDMPALKV